MIAKHRNPTRGISSKSSRSFQFTSQQISIRTSSWVPQAGRAAALGAISLNNFKILPVPISDSAPFRQFPDCNRANKEASSSLDLLALQRGRDMSSVVAWRRSAASTSHAQLHSQKFERMARAGAIAEATGPFQTCLDRSGTNEDRLVAGESDRYTPEVDDTLHRILKVIFTNKGQ
jgi:hypothetical protein